MNDFTNVSLNLTKKLTKKEKSNSGIYFTPLDGVNITINKVQKFKKNIKTILEPSVGSGQFLSVLVDKFKNADITAIEKNRKIFSRLKYKGVKLINEDFLEYRANKKFDLIIGNPPYYVMEDYPNEYRNFVIGRPNIFMFFIIKCLQLLNKNGLLAFILPNSLLNSHYYSQLRQYIYNNYQILLVENLDIDYINTEQNTFLFIVKNASKKSSKYILNINNDIVFTYNKKEVKKLLEGATTLAKLGCKVKTGNILWNENKGLLTDDRRKTLLIYNYNIVGNRLDLSVKNKKKNYIDKKDGAIDEEVIVVNRGYGTGDYRFYYAYVDVGRKFYVENHLNVIYGKNLGRILKSFGDKRTGEFIKLYFGNNGMSATELENILPIF